MSEDIYKLVEQFLNGALNEQQTQAFNNRLKTDKALENELRLRKDMNNFLVNKEKKDAFKKKLTNISADYFDKTQIPPAKEIPLKPKRNLRWLAIAASVAAITIALYWILSPKQNLYDLYAQHEPLQLTEKSGNQPTLIRQVEETFNNGDFPAALNAINELLTTQASDLQSQMVKAICLMETNQTEDARSIFKSIASGQSVFKTEAQWYMALSYLKENNIEQTKAELQKIPDNDPDWSSKVTQLLKKL